MTAELTVDSKVHETKECLWTANIVDSPGEYYFDA